MQRSHQIYFFKVCRNLGFKKMWATNSMPKTPLVLISSVLFPAFSAKNPSCSLPSAFLPCPCCVWGWSSSIWGALNFLKRDLLGQFEPVDSFPRYRHGKFHAKATGGFSSQPEALACVHIPWKFHLFKLLLIFLMLYIKKSLPWAYAVVGGSPVGCPRAVAVPAAPEPMEDAGARCEPRPHSWFVCYLQILSD